MEAFVAVRLTPRTPDLEVRGSSLACRVVSLDKELYSTYLSNRHFRHVPHLRQNRHFSWGPAGHLIRIFVKPLSIFRQIAIFPIFVKIDTFHRAPLDM